MVKNTRLQSKTRKGLDLMRNTPVYRNTDILTRVGGRAYPTIESFVNEARLQGCSRRLPRNPDWIVPGKTRMFLLHNNNHDHVAYESLFGYYTISSIHHIYDDIEWGRRDPYPDYIPVLVDSSEPPDDVAEFEDMLVTRKIVITRRVVLQKDPISEVLDELFKNWLQDVLKNLVGQRCSRNIPWSFEADNLERLCGGASNECGGRYPGNYASDDLGDWLLDQIIDFLMGDDDLEEQYFWQEVTEQEELVRRRRKNKKVAPGKSRSGRVSLKDIYRPENKPPEGVTGLVVFDEPYPLYYHPPKVPPRLFQRLDGDAMLLKAKQEQYIQS
jgi:hypothetical protein